MLSTTRSWESGCCICLPVVRCRLHRSRPECLARLAGGCKVARRSVRATETKVGPMRRHLELTAVFRKVPEGYIAFIEELPGANTQGRTLDEARVNLREAAALVLEANRTLAMQDIDQNSVIREPLRIAAD